MVAETFGIEGIVGAFFAGLAMNRLVPSHGPLMNRIDFFGAAVFVPVFLVSVGLLLDPKVMVSPRRSGSPPRSSPPAWAASSSPRS